jgi:hypothetical protein
MNTFVKDVMTSNVIWVERGTPFAPGPDAFDVVASFPVD